MNNLNPLKAQPYSMKILFVIASDRFLDMGYTVPKKLLEEHGIECVTASTVRGNCYGMQGEIAQADLTINDVDPAESMTVSSSTAVSAVRTNSGAMKNLSI